jgi:hypothetical protein
VDNCELKSIVSRPRHIANFASSGTGVIQHMDPQTYEDIALTKRS